MDIKGALTSSSTPEYDFYRIASFSLAAELAKMFTKRKLMGAAILSLYILLAVPDGTSVRNKTI